MPITQTFLLISKQAGKKLNWRTYLAFCRSEFIALVAGKEQATLYCHNKKHYAVAYSILEDAIANDFYDLI